jgi:NADPH-dependent 2,4-dienoyl-CoA reductase/sulfur reductase-like enzyme
MTAPANVVVVGASLAGLRTAEALRERGYDGRLTLIGAEAHAPYDRPPLSKQVLAGWVSPTQTTLPRLRSIDASWRLGVAALRIDRASRTICTADGDRVSYDRAVIATGCRSLPWPIPGEATLHGVHTLRTPEDAGRLIAELNAGPTRVLIVGAGFTGSEVASACRNRGLAVTMVETNAAPLMTAVGALIGKWIAFRQRDAGVDLRCGVAVTRLMGDGFGRVAGARLSDGSEVAANLVVVALGAVRNCEWLDDSDLDAGPKGCLCDASCQALDRSGKPASDIFACGDVSRFRHRLSDGRLVSLEHWNAATDQAAIVASNILHPGSASIDAYLPRFWSNQFGMSLKASGLPSCADEVMIAQGSLKAGRFVALYGAKGRPVGVVAINQSKWVTFYEAQIASGSEYPLGWRVVDPPTDNSSRPAGFPQAAVPLYAGSPHALPRAESEGRDV